RLPVSFPRATAQLPPFEDYAMDNRTYRYMRDEPLYPFGFGLSYTTFAYSNPQLGCARMSAGDTTRITVTVTNTGARAGDEVVQLYITDCEASVRVPQSALKAFTRVTLQPGEAREVAFEITPAMLALVDNAGEARVEPGTFVISVGGTSPGARSVALGAATPVTTHLEIVPA
ncbi:MAG: fibronectin type III-like domain-contianing protein, partial [bacterium]|nr:fibronectin type III-like domain-contianing protein [bacterium]